MTERQWHRHRGYPEDLFEGLADVLVPSPRKLLLYACACCRHVWSLLPSDDIRAVVAWAEDQADSLNNPTHFATGWDLEEMAANFPTDVPEHYLALAVSRIPFIIWCGIEDDRHQQVAQLIENAVWVEQCGRPETFTTEFRNLPVAAMRERFAQCGIVREILGNPYRPVAMDRNWVTSDVVAMSRGMYETRDFAAMPILADALQDGGCENPDILSHCRESGSHVRGCWVVDKLLGME